MQTTTPAALNQSEREKIIEFLKKHPVGVLAMVTTEGKAHASTIYFAADDNLRITFTTKHDTYKYENIKKNNTVMLVVFDAQNQAEVQVSGKAIEITDDQEQQAAYQGTLHAAAQTGEDIVPPITKIPAGNYVGFAIDVKDIMISEYGWGNNFANAMEHAQDPGTSQDPS